MAGSYTLPQVKVWQEFALAPNDVTQNLNPFIIGPCYRLTRYSDAGERESCRKLAYPFAEHQVLRWIEIEASKVDKDYARVTLADAVVSLSEDVTVSVEDAADIKIACTDDPSKSGHGTKFKATFTGGFAGGSFTGETGDEVFDVPVKAGDFINLGTSSAPAYVKIRSVTDDTFTVTESIAYSDKTFEFVRQGITVEVPKESTTVSDEGVAVGAGVTVKIGMFDKPVRAATAYLTQRNLMTGLGDGIYTVSNDTDIIRALGSISPDNPLGYALHIALLNCARAAVRYLAVKSDDRDGFTSALATASRSTDVYAFCPLTEDKTIIDDVVAHCKRMSEPAEKSWRIAIFSLPTPDGKDVTPKNGNTKEWCKVTIPDSGSEPILLTCYKPDGQASAAHLTETVVPGDVVTVIKTNGEPATGVVKEVKTDTTLVLEAPIAGASEAFCALTIVHPYGEAEYVTACAETSRNFMSHRAYNVFPNTLRDTDGNLVSGMFGAAAVTGLACSVQPQQPITNVEIAGFSDLSESLARFSREQLNEIAGGGTLILMQEKTDGVVYVRHQISTEYAGGNLNKTELSLIKNLDSISYYFANRCAPYHGRYNVTDDLLAELKGVITDGLAHLETTTEGNKLIGPQVLAEGTELRALYQDPSQKDHVVAQVALNLPAPFNNFDLYLFVI